jgi:hypothetical protein
MPTKDELLAKKAERAAKLAEEKEAHELLCLELEDKYSTELGVRGRAFEIVNEDNSLGVGPIVVKTPTLLAQKIYMQSDAKTTPEVAGQYVCPCVVYPAELAVRQIFAARHQMCLRCAIALTALSGYSDGEVQKKY